MRFTTPSPRLIPKGEKRDTFPAWRWSFEGCALKGRRMNEKSNLARLSIKGGPIAEIDPPNGWSAQSLFGFLRCDDGPSGRLVRLADILTWLQQRHERPRLAAMQRLIDGLTVDAIGGWLYQIRHEDYAKIHDANSGFVRFIQHEGSPEEKTLHNLLSQIRFYWGEFYFSVNDGCFIKDNDGCLVKYEVGDEINHGSKYVASLAVTFHKAHELWGWGIPVAEKPQADSLEPEPITTYPDLVQFRRANAGAAWTDDMRALLVKEEDRRKGLPGMAGVRKALGVDLGCSDKRIGELIREHQEAQRNPVTALRRAS